jgi:hypothetical protein
VITVQLDPNYEVLHATPELIAQAWDLRIYTEASFARMRNDDKAAEEKYLAALAALPRPDVHGAEFLVRSGYGDLLRRTNRLKEAKAQLELAVTCAVRKPTVLPWAYLRLALINRVLGDEESAQRAAAQAEAADKKVDGGTGIAAELAKFWAAKGQ